MLDELRLEPMPAAVAAWHNRHPLARRITAAQVQSLGYVVLPFVADGGRGRDRLRPAFSEDFLAPWTPAQVARWAQRHGRDVAGMPAGAVRRDVALDKDALGLDGTLVPLVVRTAHLELEGRQQRVLVGAGAKPAVLGRRWWAARRVGTLAGVLSLAVVALLLRMAMVAHDELGVEHEPAPFALNEAAEPSHGPDADREAKPEARPEARPESAVAAPEATASSAAAHAAASTPPPAASASASAPPPEAAASAPATRPVDVDPQWGRIDLPRIRPQLVARNKSQPQQTWAIAAPQERDARAAARRAAQIGKQLGDPSGLRVEPLAVGREWRVVGWPFRTRRAAEDALAVLARQGVKAEVVEF
ncbi:MAG: hypothetical protein U1F50_08805 [Rubrivivax sp.]